jgi:DNA-binding CsgD family transcriptional regulator
MKGERKAVAMIRNGSTASRVAKSCKLTPDQVAYLARRHGLTGRLRSNKKAETQATFRGHVMAGLTTKQIARKLNRSISWVVGSASQYGLTHRLWGNNKRARRERGWSKPNDAISRRRERVRRLLKQRKPVVEIAAILEVSVATIYKDKSTIERQDLDARLWSAGPAIARRYESAVLADEF